jgi:hypothetical protein
MKRNILIVFVVVFGVMLCSQTARAGGLLCDALFAPDNEDVALGDGEEMVPAVRPKAKKPVKEGFYLKRLEGFGQIRFTAVENDKYLVDSGDDSCADETAVERVWLCSAMRDANKTEAKWEVRLIFELTPEDINLVDFWLGYKGSKQFNFQVGQMRQRFGWQMRKSPDELVSAKYSQVNEALFGDFRDQGVRLCGDIIPRKKSLYYSAGLFNGSGPWEDDPYSTLVTRLLWEPVKKEVATKTPGKKRIKKMVSLGVSYYLGHYDVDDKTADRVRIGFDFRMLFDRTLLQGELVTNEGSTEIDKGGEPEIIGGFVELGYYLAGRKFLPVVRYDVLDDKSSEWGIETIWAMGIKYEYRDYLTFHIFYEIHEEEERQPNLDRGSILRNNEFIAQVNIRF